MQLEMQCISNGAPVQYQGTIEGRPFYFRTRNDRWFFAVADTFDEAVDAPSPLGVADYLAKHPLDMPEYLDETSGSDALLSSPFVREALWGDSRWAASFMPFEEAERIIRACAEEYVTATRQEGVRPHPFAAWRPRVTAPFQRSLLLRRRIVARLLPDNRSYDAVSIVDACPVDGEIAALLPPSAPPLPCADLASWVVAARARRPGLGA